MKKVIKYVVILLSVLAMIYAKNKIDSNNEAKVKMLDNLDDGTVKAKQK